ncbi:unnamed protein product [Rotaria sordida]|uniref:PWWP domain-containing protein n=1 Tax=Rotaria sordida TaxID=392033 RepID=A0A813X7F7_9BILA|nr:unnamed protein product [Rotaria sordida]
MNSNSLSTFSNGFNVGEIVWAKRNYDGIYWPGRILSISHNMIDTIFTHNYLQDQPWSYLTEFFEYNQKNWTIDVLPYRQYRDYMSKNLFGHYDSYPQIKYQLLNAINQADYAHINENTHPIKSNNYSSSYLFKTDSNDNYISTSNSIVTPCENSISHTMNDYSLDSYSQTSNIYCQRPSNCSCNTQSYLNNYYSYGTQPHFSSTDQLSIETNLNPVLQLNNNYHQFQNDTMNTEIETFQKQNSVIIITSKTYSNSSFISYLFNSLSNIFHSSIIYIDDLINYQHPNTYNIYYLICFDYFDLIIKQKLNLTILNNLNVYINYLFLIINAPSYELIKHLYSIIIDKQTIFILHYHLTFDNEPLLLCSGNRTKFEMIRSTFLKYLCSKIKYIESNDNEQEQFDLSNTISCISQSNNIKNISIIDILNQRLESNAFINYQNLTNESLSVSSVMKRTKKLNEQKIFKNFRKKIFKSKFKQHLSKNEMISTSSSEYCVQNILENTNFSKT